MKKIRNIILIIILMIQPVFVKAYDLITDSYGNEWYEDQIIYINNGYTDDGSTWVCPNWEHMIYADVPQGYLFSYWQNDYGLIYYEQDFLYDFNEQGGSITAYFEEVQVETATIYFNDGYINGNYFYAEVNVGEYAYIEVEIPSGKKLDYVYIMGDSYYEEAFDLYIDEVYANMTINIEAYFSDLDSVPPVFSGPSVINTTKYEVLTVSNIKARLSAYDVVDGNVTFRIALYSNNYSTNASINGTYQMIFIVWDVANNWAYWTITINVKDMDPPQFYVNSWFVSISEFDNITLEKIIEILSYQS